jgi:uncharacterized protein
MMTAEAATVALPCLFVLAAGIVRGYSGFGFSMISVVSLSLFLPPARVVPVILLLEVMASAWLLPRVWRRIHWTSLTWLSPGMVAGIPAGVHLLAIAPVRFMRMAIALVVMVLAVLLWRGFQLKKMPGRGKIVATGLVSGILNGSTSMGGPPVILFYFSGPAGATVSRATLIFYFFCTDILAFGMSMAHGLVDTHSVVLGGVFLVPLLCGVSLGNRLFRNSEAEVFKRRVLGLLMLLAVIASVRSFWA